MKILFATDQYGPTPGGISVVVHRLAHVLVAKGHTVAILAPSESWKFHKDDEEGVTIYRVQSFLVHKLKKVRYAPAFLYQNRIKKILQTFMPDIVHIETPDAIASAAYEEARLLHIPVIGTCHIMPQNISGALPFLPSQIRRFVGNLYMKQLANLFNKIDFVTAPTMTGIAILKAHGVKTSMQVLSNGINLENFYTVSLEEQDAARKHFSLPSEPTILYVGRLDKEKRVEVLVQAVSQLPKDLSCHTVIAGTGDQSKLLKALVKKLHLTSKITFLGMLSEKELRDLYNLATVFVMPSTAELQSLVTMEAMAIGKPVIGARAGALPYLIKDNENGYLFAPDDHLDLSHKLQKILASKQLQKEFGKASYAIVQAHDIQKVVDELVVLYEQIIARQHAYPKAFMSKPLQEAA